MSEVFRKRVGTAAVNWFHQQRDRSNQYCLYCGRFVGNEADIESNKEHLIGRNMVPSGSFADPAAFNFFFRACVDCNTEKSHLEDHVSAVTLLTSLGRSERDDVNALAQRKAQKSFSPTHPGKRVAEIRNEQTIKFGDVFSFGLVAPTQIEPSRARLLAFRHIQGLFSLTTSVDPITVIGTRLLPSYHFGFYAFYGHRDWGNSQLVEISRRVQQMPIVAGITSASGYFKAIVRRPDQGGSPWFWALEWNKSVRLTGWVGKADEPPPVFSELPNLKWHEMYSQNGIRVRTREEQALSEEDDIMFDF